MKFSSATKSLGTWIMIFLVMVIIANLAYSPALKNNAEKLSYTDFTERVVKGEVAEVETKTFVVDH